MNVSFAAGLDVSALPSIFHLSLADMFEQPKCTFAAASEITLSRLALAATASLGMPLCDCHPDGKPGAEWEEACFCENFDALLLSGEYPEALNKLLNKPVHACMHECAPRTHATNT